MRLEQAMIAAGLTPPRELTPGRWLRFPGAGKGRANRSGWCRIISPTLAVFGDWSSGLSVTWHDDSAHDDERSRQLTQEARDRERQFAAAQRDRQARAAEQARDIIRAAEMRTHPYLAAKGFPDALGLVFGDQLVVPMRDVADYRKVLGAQHISSDGTKRFLAGARAAGAIHRIGSRHPRHVWLCEGYATGLTLRAALERLPGPHDVVVCFSARNLEAVAPYFSNAVVAADHDQSGTGERAARATGLQWVMPPEVGDFNDLYQASGVQAVVGALRQATS